MNGRIGLASLLAVGFMVLIGISMFATVAENAQRIVDGSMGALGVALANAVAGIFRSDQADDQRAKNTGAAFDFGIKALNSTPANEQASGKADDPLHVVPEERE